MDDDPVRSWEPATVVMFTDEELRAIYALIEQLSGFNPESVFAWDGTDSCEDPTTSAMAKLFEATGHSVPEEVRAPQQSITIEDSW